jgi:hypothetical protein
MAAPAECRLTVHGDTGADIERPTYASATLGVCLVCAQRACARRVLVMERFTDARAVRPADFVTAADQLRLAVAAYLARFSGSSHDHAHSDLRCLLAWCAQRGLDPLTARRVHLEVYIRWIQEVRPFKPSTVSPAVLGDGGVLPDRGDRRRAGALAG